MKSKMELDEGLVQRSTDLVTAVFPELDASHHLLEDEVGSHLVFTGVMPWGKDLLAEKQPPGGIALLGTLLFGVLFTLGDGIHYMVPSTAQ